MINFTVEHVFAIKSLKRSEDAPRHRDPFDRLLLAQAKTSGRLGAYLADIDRQAQALFERLIEGMKQAQGTEQLKAENALEWTGRHNNVWACAREVVEREIIYS